MVRSNFVKSTRPSAKRLVLLTEWHQIAVGAIYILEI